MYKNRVFKHIFGRLAHLVERVAVNREVVGS
jgi:hypothetical protein